MLVNSYIEPWQAVLEYKRQVFKGRTLVETNKFFKELGHNPEVHKLIDLRLYALEAETVEKQWFTFSTSGIKPNEELSHQYQYLQNFLKGLSSYAMSLQKTGLRKEDELALRLVYSTVLSKVIGIRRAENVLNVVKTKGYFDSLVTQLSTLKQKQNAVAIREESKNFESKMLAKVKETEKLLKETVQPAIENAHKTLKQMNEKLLAELNQYLKKAENDIQEKKQMKRDFESMAGLNTFLGILDTVGSVAKFLGPKGAAAAGVISGGTNLIRSFAMKKRGRRSTAAPGLAGLVLDPTSLERYQLKIKTIERELSLTVEAGSMEGGKLHGVMGIANATRTNLEAFKNALVAVDENVDLVNVLQAERKVDLSTGQLRDVTSKILEKAETEQSASDMNSPEKTSENDAKPENSKTIESLNYIGGIMEVGASVKGLIDDISDSGSQLEKLKALVKQAKENKKAIERKKNEFYDDFLPQITSINTELQNESDHLAGQSHAGLSVKKWKIKGLVKTLRGHVQQFAKEYNVSEQFQVGFDTLDEALVLLVDMYDHIERYYEKQELADLIVNVNGADGVKSQITDASMRKILESLEFHVHVNLFLVEYQRAMHAFKQWAFPFASHYLAGRKEKPSEIFSNSSTIAEIANAYIEKVKGLQGVLGMYNSATVRGDEVQIVRNFTSSAKSSKPFYVWTNDRWQGSIGKMLQGQKIKLRADVDMSGVATNVQKFFRYKSAIKFKDILLVLRAKNSSRQVELNERLDHFEMKMTHSGISVYKVMGQQYIMFDNKQTYIYSFEFIGDERVSKNLVTKKISSDDADHLMSPYTWWTFELIDSTPDEGLGFTDLAEFSQEIDLELQGTGVYLDEERAPEALLNDLNMAEQYEIFDAKAANNN